MPFPPKASDADPAVPIENDANKLMRAQQRAGASLQQQSIAAKNFEPPQKLYDPVTNTHYFIAAPTPLNSLFGPPLVPTGPNSRNGKRLVTSGWGSARDIAYKNAVHGTRRHAGLDFAAPVGENVIASADGTVVFIGVQLRHAPSPYSLIKPAVLSNGNITGTDKETGEAVEIPHTDLGHGGMYVGIGHNGDFQNYTTQYMHLSAVNPALAEGQSVTKSQVIGAVGTTGGSSNGIVHSDPHVHWQVRFRSALVKPEELVDFYMPGYTPSDQKAFLVDLGNPNSSNGAALIQKVNAGQVQTLQRGNIAENQTQADHQAAHSAYLANIATRMNAAASKSLQAMATFEQALPVVNDALAFDYDKGVWNDLNGASPKAGTEL
jgi:murein DD-endopeptidase MepM/ murein hydrolase activator NlpD